MLKNTEQFQRWMLDHTHGRLAFLSMLVALGAWLVFWFDIE
ncbi:hypothetical protein ACSFBI_17020 [Variovorax sp. RB3P1]|jgi:hypothetical protein